MRTVSQYVISKGEALKPLVNKSVAFTNNRTGASYYGILKAIRITEGKMCVDSVTKMDISSGVAVQVFGSKRWFTVKDYTVEEYKAA